MSVGVEGSIANRMLPFTDDRSVDEITKGRSQLQQLLRPFVPSFALFRPLQPRIDWRLALIFIARDLFRTSGEWPITARERRAARRRG